MPTPSIDPISVCELDTGRPMYQVPRFQMMGDNSNAMNMAKRVSVRTWRMSSIGSSVHDGEGNSAGRGYDKQEITQAGTHHGCGVA